ncbi:RNA polymerase sigma factor SigW [Thermaerobacillus caldiproteolyticus]|uniref:RNA polymerase sigma factor SigW n=1 Tax=Thermaerobacillus caldiproteolyticus TaxID=247480 RepID=A0A7V9Z975_9BACL|nr:RNA polymerase sigma factor SigW [Anoxybacillus caldiproteolyticus]MBA2876271.1 RNA polymerase sigma-70 factor (ECF subfamily) [Anoxybacillus caldiproteolyticus]QPA31100.1 RNA polymerase sigma factor SigW [Anoxybacillus caldiproteolyticus]
METFIKKRIKAIKKGDQNAYAEIVELYKDKVYRLCYRMLGNRHEAEDAAQEAFVRAYINIHTYNTNMKFSSWLYRIATNLSIDKIRKKKPSVYLDEEVSGTEGLTVYSQLPSTEASPEETLESLELQETVQKAIEKLPEKYRSVIVLKYIEDLSLQEISEILDIPIGTVKTRIHRGREALRKHLGHL